MVRIVSFPAPSGYQSRWDSPGKVGITHLQTSLAIGSVRLTWARSVQHAMEHACIQRQCHMTVLRQATEHIGRAHPPAADYD